MRASELFWTAHAAAECIAASLSIRKDASTAVFTDPVQPLEIYTVITCAARSLRRQRCPRALLWLGHFARVARVGAILEGSHALFEKWNCAEHIRPT